MATSLFSVPLMFAGVAAVACFGARAQSVDPLCFGNVSDLSCQESIDWSDDAVHLLQLGHRAKQRRRLHQRLSDGPEIRKSAWGLDLEGMRREVKPGENWNDFVSGEWLKETEIPDDKSSWGSFAAVQQETDYQLKALLEEGADEGTLIGNLYASFMDERRLEQLGVAPAVSRMKPIHGIATASDLARFHGLMSFGIGTPIFDLQVTSNQTSPGNNAIYVVMDGLGMPSREYYLDDRFADAKQAYAEMAESLLKAVEWPDVDAVNKVLEFEGEIARLTWPAEVSNDPAKAFKEITFGELVEKAEGFDWKVFANATGLNMNPQTNIVAVGWNHSGKDGLIAVAELVGKTSTSTLRAWTAVNIMTSMAAYLSKDFVDVAFKYSQVLTGQETIRPRWNRGVDFVSGHLPDAVGKDFVAKYFPPSSKAKMDELTPLLKEAFMSRLKKVTWMTESTKDAALKKLTEFRFEIGVPNKFKDTSGLTMRRTDLIGNIERAFAHSWRWSLSQVNKPVDRDLWPLPPQSVNAFFEQTQNRVVFLAALLKPPFFNPDGDVAVNFGAIGSIIGHEMTHGFDSAGRQYDEEGKLRDWWSPEDADEFQKRADKYSEQFAEFTAGLPAGFHIRPELTVNENIADLGGVAIGHGALQMWLTTHEYTPDGPWLKDDGDVGAEADRRFFAGWAQVWRTKARPSALKNQLMTDVHAPGPARATVPVQNTDAWYFAYDVDEGQALFRSQDERVTIW